MKVLQINSFFSAGGPPRIVKGIYDTIVRNGEECLLASAREKPVPGMNVYRIGTSLTTYSCAIQARLFDNDGFAARNATRRLIEEIKHYSPDIIQLHNLHSYYINVGILFEFLSKYGKPVVWTFHDCWPMTGHCPHFSMAACDRYLTGCHHCPQKSEFPASLLLDQSKRNWNRKKAAFTNVPNLTIVCVSKWLESVVRTSYMRNYPTRVIYNGLDLKPFHRTESGFRADNGLVDKKVLLGVALHWGTKKGLNDYIALSKLLDSSYQIVLVGLSKGEVKDLPANITPIPPISDDTRLAEIYSTADLCLNLSYEETFGLTSIEALACGTPIITYNQTAVPEVAHMYDMPVVPAGDTKALAGAIENHFRQPDHQTVFDVSQFEEKTQYQHYYDLYKELVTAR